MTPVECSIAIAVVLGIIFCWFVIANHQDQLRREQETQKAAAKKEDQRRRIEARERKRLERKAWEESPEGLAHLEAERTKKEALEKLKREAREAAEEADRQRRAEEERIRKIAEEERARREWHEFYRSRQLSEVDTMSGREFEQFVCRLLARLGYKAIVLTPINNDQGGDILCESPDNADVVVQVKRWKDSVGNAVIQELLGAMTYYGRDSGLVVTSSRFTRSATALASKKPRIRLCDRVWLEEVLRSCMPPVVPDFSWDEYEKNVKPWLDLKVLDSPPSQQITQRQKSPRVRNSRRRRWRRRWR